VLPTDKQNPLRQWCSRNVLIPVTLFFIAGILFSSYQPALFAPEFTIFCFVILSVTTILLYRKQNQYAVFLCLPLFFLLGQTTMTHHIAKPLHKRNIASIIQQSCKATLFGRLTSMVEQGDSKNRFELTVHKLLIHSKEQQWQDAHGRIRLSFRGNAKGLKPGQLLMVLAQVEPITNFKTPGAFDYNGYMAAKNMHVHGWIQARRDIVQVHNRVENRLWSLQYLPEQIRQRVAVFLQDHLPREIAGIYQALLVGSRARVSPKILERFKATGTMHLLAISGIHMGLLGIMIGTILNWLLRRSEWLLLHTYVPGLALLGTLPVLLGYGFIAGMNTPVLRALIMASILLWAILLRKQHDLLHLIAAAALFILVCNPQALFTVSFQLSFAAVTAMVFFLPRHVHPVFPETDEQQRSALLNRYLKTGLIISCAATVGTLPFMLYHFQRFSLIGPVMNLLVEPLLCFWALPFGLAAIPCMFFLPDLAVLLLKTGSVGIQASQYCTALGSSLPFASLWTIQPTINEIIAYGLLLVLFFWRNKQKKIFVPLIVLGSALLFLHFTQTLFWPEKPGISKISFLDVGQGNATFLHLPDGSRILVDGGGGRNTSFNSGERIIAPFLWHKRIWRLDKAVITHPHSDHFNGMDFLLPRFRPKILLINGDDRGEGNYFQVLALAKKMNIQVQVPQAGQSIAGNTNYGLTVLGMNGLQVAANSPVNDRCLVLRYTHGKQSFFLPADISAKSERKIISRWRDVQSDVLLASHHGSATASSQEFIQAIQPSLIVVSAGKNGKKYYPDPDNLARWQQQNITTFITRNQGTVTCITDGEALDCSPFAKKAQSRKRQ
jgi:competence protein ComEC